ncbi:MAG TPA: CoA transferase [Dehalococcoidia bacterium]|nr:CoA transferase [Dehalococcoidia bacterium]
MKTAADALREIDAAVSAGLPLEDATFSGEEPVLPSRFALATAGAAAIAASGLAAAALWRERTGQGQQVSVDLRHAAAALRSSSYLRIDGRPPGSPWAPISGFYRTRDERWVQFHCNYPHHRDGVLELLRCENDPEAVQAAARRWDAQPLEDALAANGMCAGIVRARAEWEAHPQGIAVSRLPLMEVLRIGDSPPEPLPEAARPLSGVRVLDLTRVLAGPTGARTLAEHGADVLRITAAHLPAQPEVDADTGHGKLSARLDLRQPGDHERLLSLVREGDVFVQSYRPGALAGRGLSPDALAALRPGIVYVTLAAYGHEGPWRDRRGFDSLVQSVSGFVSEHSLGGRVSGAAAPRHLPAQAIDYVSGYLMAFGAMVGLLQRAREGGSYLVRVSLAQTGHWIWGLGSAEDEPAAASGLSEADVGALLGESLSPLGRLTFIRPVVGMSVTEPRWDRPSVPLDYHPPQWPPR